jgi:hypothetical protein
LSFLRLQPDLDQAAHGLWPIDCGIMLFSDPFVDQRSIEATLREMARKRLDEAPAPTYRGGRCELMDILDGA